MIATDKYLGEVFKQPPLTAFRRQNNLRDMLVKSKVPPPAPLHPSRQLKGLSKCGKAYPACPFVREGKEIKLEDRTIWTIEKKD